MDPLSTYRMTVMPGLRPATMPAVPDAAKIIPKEELDKLPSSNLQAPAGPSAASSTGFQGFLGNLVNEVSAKQTEASEAMKSVIGGGDVQLHQAMIAVEEASVSFQLMVEVRNRLLESYQELMRMQV